MDKIVRLEYDTSYNGVSVSDDIIRDFKDLLSGCRINFLLGAGFSANLLGVLNNKEIILESLKKFAPQSDDERKKRDILLAYIYWAFLTDSICKIGNIDKADSSFNDYYDFANIIYQILEDKSNPVLNKHANIFTTNYDPIIEIAFEESKNICNDGFDGRIEPKFSTSNYSMSYFREAFYSNRSAEIPSVNVFKIHGSITWRKNDRDEIVYADYAEKIKDFCNCYSHSFDSNYSSYLEGELSSNDKTVIEGKINNIIKSTSLDSVISNHNLFENFLHGYHELFLIVNPTKDKFADTLLNRNYYELLRMFSNEMEKENTLLIVIGFSFADEHILDLVKRSMVNPSLKVIVFCHSESDISSYEDKFKDLKTDEITYICLETGKKMSITQVNQVLKEIHI